MLRAAERLTSAGQTPARQAIREEAANQAERLDQVAEDLEGAVAAHVLERAQALPRRGIGIGLPRRLQRRLPFQLRPRSRETKNVFPLS